jgi:hypothetical protein
VLFIGTLLMAVGFASLHGLNPHSTYPEFAWPTLILATGIGMCTAPTTSAIMGAVPDEKQGVASAVNDTSREMGGALGIAVAGSILAGLFLRTRTQAGGLSRRGPRARDRFAGQSRRAGRQAWAPRAPAGRSQQDRIPDSHARFYDHNGRHCQPCGDPDRTVGARA